MTVPPVIVVARNATAYSGTFGDSSASVSPLPKPLGDQRAGHAADLVVELGERQLAPGRAVDQRGLVAELLGALEDEGDERGVGDLDVGQRALDRHVPEATRIVDLRATAEELRRLHADEELLVLPNVWDAASARTVAAQPGCRALATASWSIAAALGRHDHQVLAREEMLAAVTRIASAVDVPVTADLEAGYGAGPGGVAATVRGAIAAGAVGCNLEDRVPGGLRGLGEAVERVAAAVGAGTAADVPLVVNARTDVYLLSPEDAPADPFVGGRSSAAVRTSTRAPTACSYRARSRPTSSVRSSARSGRSACSPRRRLPRSPSSSDSACGA